MFDLPTESAEEKDSYRKFRKILLDDGFQMLQYSVYARYCASEEIMRIHKSRIALSVPDLGQVRVLSMTDKQFGMIDVFQ